MNPDKLKWKEHCILRAISMVDGAVSEYMERTMKDVNKPSEDDNKNHFWQSLAWLDDSMKGYYLGWDFEKDSYMLEWRGRIKHNDGSTEIITMHIMTCSGTGFYLIGYFLKAMKNHKREIKDWIAE